jgi:hypothetical protein
MREYIEKLYSGKWEYLEEMDKFLDVFHLPKLNQEDVIYLNRSITSNEIEAVIKVPSKNGKPKTHCIHC